MNWIDMTACPEQEYTYLQQEIANKHHLVFSQVIMPADCGACVCTVSFLQHPSQAITLSISPKPDYSGSSPAIRDWCSKGAVTFSSFAALKSFLRSFSPAAVPSAPVTPTQPEDPAPQPPAPSRPPLRVDRSKLNPHSPAVQAPPPFLSLDPEALEAELHKKVIGQQDAVSKIAYLTAVHLGQRRHRSPLSVVLWGTTGVGKTEVAKQLPPALNNLTDNQYDFHLEVVDCTQMKESHSTARLTGSPPGYVGHGDKCIWDCVLQHPRTVFVFNELEKAHPSVLQVLMEAVDSGQQEASHVLENGQRYYDLSRCLFFFTSNMDLNQPAKKPGIGFARPGTVPAPQPVREEPVHLSTMGRIIRDNERDREALMALGTYPPEVIARFTAFVRFRPFTNEDILDLVELKLSETAYEQHALCLVYADPPLVQELFDLAAPQVNRSGVRVLQRIIDTYLGAAFMHFSHQCEEYTSVALAGSLEAPVITEAA